MSDTVVTTLMAATGFTKACGDTDKSPILLFVRHPETVSNAVLTGVSAHKIGKSEHPAFKVLDTPLTELGEQQVAHVVAYISAFLEDADATADMISSPLSRAQAIAFELRLDVRVRSSVILPVVEEINEAKYGPVSGKFAAFGVRGHANTEDWLSDVRAQWADIRARMIAMTERQVLIVVGHSLWFSAVLQLAAFGDFTASRHFNFHHCNCAIDGLGYNPDRDTWEILFVNSIAHMPPELATGLHGPNFRPDE